MRVVAALGGNALLERGEKPDADIQQYHVEQAVAALTPLARAHDLVLTHGNGPQVGLLALESERDPALSHPYSLDILGAQTQGMIGYWLARSLHGAVPGKTATAPFRVLDTGESKGVWLAVGTRCLVNSRFPVVDPAPRRCAGYPPAGRV